MNKLLGQLMTMLLAPDEEGNGGGSGEPAAGDMYSGTKIPSKEEVEQDTSEVGAEGSGDESEQGGEEGEDFSDEEGGESDEGDEQGDESDDGESDDKKTPVLRIDPRDLAALRNNQASTGEKGEEKLTPEQIKALVNPVEVTDDLVAAISHEDPKVRAKALQQFANATVKNAYSLAKLLVERKTKEFEGIVGPLVQQQQEARLHQTKQAFYTSYPDLTKYDIVVKAAAEEVEPVGSDGRPKSQAQIFKEVALLTRKKLQALGVQLKQAGANHSADNGKQVPKPNKFSSSGRSGGDQHSGRGKPNNADADIYAR